MDRLTEPGYVYESCDFSEDGMAEPFNRLSTYEDTDLTPEQIQELRIENAQLHAIIAESDPDFFKRKCRVCGCDWNHPCNDHDFWVEDDLCSACAM